VFLTDTLIWLAIHNSIRYNWYDAKDFTVEQFGTVSLDLRINASCKAKCWCVERLPLFFFILTR
jgi:hypothetical protein